MSTTSSSTTVAILGNGVVGVALAKGFAGLGYQVVFGTRDASSDKTRAALQAVPGARAASPAEAAQAGDFAVLALPFDALEAGIRGAGVQNLAGKLVIETTNPLDFSTGAPVWALGHSDSAGERVQRWLPESKVVKAFNIITASHMVHPQLPDGQPDMFIAGNDEPAKARVSEWLRAWGWRAPVDMGGIEASRLLEALAMLWIHYGVRHNHWTHGFSLLGRKPA